MNNIKQALESAEKLISKAIIFESEAQEYLSESNYELNGCLGDCAATIAVNGKQVLEDVKAALAEIESETSSVELEGVISDLLENALVSFDISSGNHNKEYRLFGRVYEVLEKRYGADELTILAVPDISSINDYKNSGCGYFEILHKNGTVTLIDRSPDSYELRECKIRALDYADKLFTSPQQQWVGLSDEDIRQCEQYPSRLYADHAKVIEAKLKQLNTKG